ncbi:hypothetical protein LPJ56_000774 [Coemansia sp. RSA 2599]|nr:hypothetical protein LPJ56_000774 [Coemansia sp. RSA 2599]
MDDYSPKHVFDFQAVAGVELTLFGLFFMLASHRHLKILQHAVIFVFWHSVVLLLCHKIRPTDPTETAKRPMLYLVISQLTGAVLSIGTNKSLVGYSWMAGETAWTTAGNAVMGCLSGLAVGVYVLASSNTGMFSSVVARALVVLLTTAFCCSLMVRDPRHMRNACSAIVGAYVFVLGVDCFAQAGYFNHLIVFVGVNGRAAYAAGDGAMVLHAMTPVFSLIAGLWQAYDGRGVLQSRAWTWPI